MLESETLVNNIHMDKCDLKSPEYIYLLEALDRFYCQNLGITIVRITSGAYLQTEKAKDRITGTELTLLDMLVFHSPDVVSRTVLLKSIGMDPESYNAINVNISRIREVLSRLLSPELSKKIIETVTGEGYVLHCLEEI